MINSAPPVRAVTFDVDDTLVNHSEAAQQALEAVGGRPGTFALWQRITDEHAAAVIAGRLSYSGAHTARTKAYFAELGDYIDEVQAEWIDGQRRREHAARLRAFDDVVDCLEWLRQTGLRIGAVTNASGGHQRRKLAELGIGGYFDSVVIAGEAGTRKPEPGIFEQACSELGTCPALSMHLGDKWHTDAGAARSAGLHGVWLDRSGRGAGELDERIPMLQTLAELPELLIGDYDPEPAVPLAEPGYSRRW